MAKPSPGRWIGKAVDANKGGLHRSLGVPVGQKIPQAKIEAAEAKGGKVAKQARLAETLSKLRK